MDQGLPTNSSAVNLVCCLFIAVMILSVNAFLNETLEPIQTVVEKPVANKVVIPISMPEKHPTVNMEDISVSVCSKKAEQLFHPIIIQAANRNQVDPALVKAIIMAESNYNPKAISNKGARGLMQLMPGTAEELGVKDIFNPEHNVNAGVKYFKQLLNQFDGDMKLALAAYNAGISRVRQYQGIPPFKVTQYYIKKVCKYYKYYRKQMALDIDSI